MAGGRPPAQPHSEDASLKSKVSLVVPARDGLAPYKTTVRLLREAKEHGLATVIGVDTRTIDGTVEAVRPFADQLLELRNDTCYCEENMNELVAAARTDWCLWICDDELPSEQLWRLASDPKRLPAGGIYRPHILSPLPGWAASYVPLNTYQPRLFQQGAIKWQPGGLDRLPIMALPQYDLDAVLWHFNLWASRESREAKTIAHERAWMEAWEYHPWPPGSRKAYLWEDYPDEVESLDPWREFLPEEVR